MLDFDNLIRHLLNRSDKKEQLHRVLHSDNLNQRISGGTLEFGSKMKHIKTFKDFKDNIDLFTIPRDKRSILAMCGIIKA